MTMEETLTTEAEEADDTSKKTKTAEPDFASLKEPAEIVLCYNEMTRSAGAPPLNLSYEPVEGFASIAEGVAACEKIFAAIVARQAETLPKKKRPATKKTPAKRKEKTVKSPGKKVVAPKKAAATKKTAPAKRSGSIERATDIPDTMIIHWKGADKEGKNPAKEGSGRFERIERVRKHDGKTVAAFKKAGGKLGTLFACWQELGLVVVKAA